MILGEGGGGNCERHSQPLMAQLEFHSLSLNRVGLGGDTY